MNTISPEALRANVGLLHQTRDRLIRAGVGFGIYSGFHAMMLAGHRQTDDIDIWADERRFEDICAAFPEADVQEAWRGSEGLVVKGIHEGFAINLGGVSILGASVVRLNDEIYPTEFASIRDRVAWHDYGWVAAHFVDPVDTLLTKAITQRGVKEGKHDIEDIEAIVRTVPIDVEYLKIRITQTKTTNRVGPLLRRLGVL